MNRGDRQWLVGVSFLVTALVVACISPSARAEAQCGAVPEVMLLLDRSGSMKEAVGDQSKAEVAKKAIEGVLADFAGELRFGLSLFPRWPHVTHCSEAAVNVAPASGTTASIKGLLNSTFPEGNTPITASLDAAGAYFAGKTDRPRYVLLVTDGMETCVDEPKPTSQPGSCAWESGSNKRRCGGCGWQFCLSSGTWSSQCVAHYGCPFGQTCAADGQCGGPIGGAFSASSAAQQLAQSGIKTFVVGFGDKVDTVALADVAAAGGTGDYHQADDLIQLAAALKKIAAAISCCGNGALDPGELCDTKISAGQPGACPTASCDDGDSCTVDSLVGQACRQRCDHLPQAVAKPGDGCCPVGATHLDDSDCPALEKCGDGQVEPGESCDVAILAGQPGACPTDCDDGDPCTSDEVSGALCASHCASEPLGPDATLADGCCPEGLTQDQDADCLPLCTPDRTIDCIDPCDNVACQDGTYCIGGTCQPWPDHGIDRVGGGCDCRAGGASLKRSWPILLLALVGLLGRRRRR